MNDFHKDIALSNGFLYFFFLRDTVHRGSAAAYPGMKGSCHTEQTGQDEKHPEWSFRKKCADHRAQRPADIVADTDLAVIAGTFFR